MKPTIILYFSSILLLPACIFYSFKGSLPSHIHSISLAPIVNESTEFSAAEILNDELNELMVSENVLDIVSPDKADSHLEVVITSVKDRPYTVSLSDELGMEEVEEWRLTISTQGTWYDIKRDEILMEKRMTSWGVSAPGVDIGTDGLDNDGDGFSTDTDCDDENPQVNPDADEVCDGIDNDCDNLTDDEDDGLNLSPDRS